MKKGPFDDAIEDLKVSIWTGKDAGVKEGDPQMKSFRHAIRVLKAAGKVDRDQLPWTLGFLRDTFAQSIVALLESLPGAGKEES